MQGDKLYATASWSEDAAETTTCKCIAATQACRLMSNGHSLDNVVFGLQSKAMQGNAVQQVQLSDQVL